jgi:hypothetical protein
MLNLEKTHLDLNEISFRRLEQEGLGVSAGRIAKLLLSIQNENIAGFYEQLKLAHVQPLLSHAQGNNLDLVGELLSCDRKDGEEDEDYRYRISKQSLTLASANETAVRLACLSVPGVDDVILKAYTHGTGSFAVYVVSDTPQTPDSVLYDVNKALDGMKAYGIRAAAFAPKLIPVELRARIIFDKKVVDLDRQMVRKQAEQLIKDSINQLSVGASLDPRELEKEIVRSHSDIYSVDIYHFRVNNRPCLLVEQSTSWNERFVQASEPNAVLVS